MVRQSAALIKNVAAQVRQHRKSKGISQRALAAMCQMKSHRTITEVESGTHEFSLDTLCRVCEALDIQLSIVLTPTFQNS